MNSSTKPKPMNPLRRVAGYLLFEPRAYADISHVRIWNAVAIVLTTAVLTAWANLRYAGLLGLQLFPSLRVAVTIVLVFAFWLSLTIMLHFYSRVLSLKGSVQSASKLLAFASLPLLLQQLLRLLDTIYASKGEAVLLSRPLSISLNQPVNILLNSLLAVFTVFGCWAFILLVIAVRNNYGTSYVKSAIVALLTFVTVAIIVTPFAAR